MGGGLRAAEVCLGWPPNTIFLPLRDGKRATIQPRLGFCGLKAASRVAQAGFPK